LSQHTTNGIANRLLPTYHIYGWTTDSWSCFIRS